MDYGQSQPKTDHDSFDLRRSLSLHDTVLRDDN
jgi:hypothetical protein